MASIRFMSCGSSELVFCGIVFKRSFSASKDLQKHQGHVTSRDLTDKKNLMKLDNDSLRYRRIQKFKHNII